MGRREQNEKLREDSEDWLRKRGKKIKPHVNDENIRNMKLCFQIFDADASGKTDLTLVRFSSNVVLPLSYFQRRFQNFISILKPERELRFLLTLGCISGEEVRQAFKLLHVPCTAADVKAIMDEADTDHSGELDEDEFVQMMIGVLDNMKFQNKQGNTKFAAAGEKLDLKPLAITVKRRNLLDTILVQNNYDQPTLRALSSLFPEGAAHEGLSDKTINQAQAP
ncbi:hypothetical protein CYMTET_25110 [Cymbomonas tetramitiformis]|uniref:EF-hand domain-containing protein n=1 Tax=Cymbomonas tetramitiformis TaxID=36881 RepID=A0AAE0KZ85_9CHLO|nr:hypothetical protein CYMTET_25110 [Cymbomonas tetramitiformis]